MPKKEAAGFDLQEKFRTDDEIHEFFARELYDMPNMTFQAYTLQRLLPENWQQKLDVLRQKQRALGVPDYEFLHNKRKKEMGLPHRDGHRRKLKKVA